MRFNKPRIGILTNFSGADETFSLVVVVKTQLKMLRDAGYSPVLFVAEEFNTGNLTGIFSTKQTEVRRVAPFDAKLDVIADSLRKSTVDIDVLLCHDLVFLSNYKQWGDAVRALAKERDDLGFIHWQHSRGDHIVDEPCEHSLYAYPNQGDLPHVATMNKSDIDRIRYVPHPLDFNYLGWPELAIRIAEETNYPFVDVSGVLPTRLDRQKQVEKAMRVFAGIKKTGRSVCFIIADAYATGDRFKQYKREVEKIAKQQGLSETEFMFLGERYAECEVSTPKAVVKALYEMGNLFIQPSNAETSSLVAMEASLAGNLLVINADFPPIHHLYGKSLTLPFGSVLQAEPTKYFRHIRTADGSEVKVEDPQLFFDDQARLAILPVLDGQIAQQIKRQQLRDRWPSRVFKGFVEPLILEICPERLAKVRRGDPEVTAIITTLDNLPILKEQIPILLEECGHVIVVNNGSIDGTREWLEENATDGMSYINRENNGAGPGRNAGLDLWNNSTPYTLMVDGGILPVVGSVKALKDYLVANEEIHVISPEVMSCFTTERDKASLRFDHELKNEDVFLQSCLSSTAFALCRASAWVVRFSEEGPYAEPGWGVDDNDMSYRWNTARIFHRDFTYPATGIMYYRRAGGSHKRLLEETGVSAGGHGSVYEKRNCKCWQDWPHFHRGLWGKPGKIEKSYVFRGIEYPELARLVKKTHDAAMIEEDKEKIGYEVVVYTDGLSDATKDWIAERRYRFHKGDAVVDKHGKVIRRNADNEELWTGDFRVDEEPRGEVIDVAQQVDILT